jgi:hypothetical protein
VKMCGEKEMPETDPSVAVLNIGMFWQWAKKRVEMRGPRGGYLDRIGCVCVSDNALQGGDL